MTTSSVEGVANGIFAPADATAADTSGTQQDSDMFLQLMVAQLKYQDPMNPTDSSTMLTQNATFTEVQSMQELQKEMSMLLSSQLAFGAASMIGKQVSWTDADGNVQSGTVSGTTFAASGPTLSVNGTDVPVASVTTVAPAPTTAAGTGDTSTTQS
jgi:flagellar basal-body rod modification protein FlgD